MKGKYNAIQIESFMSNALNILNLIVNKFCIDDIYSNSC